MSSIEIIKDDISDLCCNVCLSGDDADKLVVCDMCDCAGTHTTCMVPVLKAIPKDDWYCSDCKGKRARITGKLSEESGHLKTCLYEGHINRPRFGIKKVCSYTRIIRDDVSGRYERCGGVLTNLACLESGETQGYCSIHYNQLCQTRGWCNAISACANQLCDDLEIPLDSRYDINQNTIFQKLCLSGEEEFGHISISTRQVTEREKDYEEESEEDELEDIDREEDDESDGEQSIASEGEEDEGEECDIVPNPKRQRVGDDKGQVFKLGDIVSICGDNERCRYYVDEILLRRNKQPKYKLENVVTDVGPTEMEGWYKAKDIRLSKETAQEIIQKWQDEHLYSGL